MKRCSVLAAGLLLALGSACSDGGTSSSNSAGDSDSIGGDGDGDGDGDSNGDGDGDSQGDGDGDGDGDSGDGDGDGDGDSGDGDGEGEPKFDTLSVPDASENCGAGGGNGGDPDFSYIWIANSQQGTVSKIDTQEIVELGRYLVHPQGPTGNPSRTSVNLSGDVAIANRTGGVTKVYAVEERCVDMNGQPGIQTATDANYLPWGDDDCVAWHTPMNYGSQRPVAWAPGVFNEGTCAWEDEKLWTAGANGNDIEVLLVDGETGNVDEVIPIVGVTSGYYGIYGAAVDGEGHMWGSKLGGQTLVRVDREDFTFQTWPVTGGGYGMTVDPDGYVWTCSSNASRFDPVNETWDVFAVGGSGGCMADDEGRLWISANTSGIVGVDRETGQVVENQSFGGTYIHGTSVDFYGYVWAVSYNTPFAYRMDPDDPQNYETFTGLTGPYTYSDMTGFALKSAGIPNG